MPPPQQQREEPPAASSSGVPKMMVSDKNGEVSASVEETNRVRALLGLKPLQVKGGGGGGGGAAAAADAAVAAAPPPAPPSGATILGPTLPASGAAPKPSASGKELKQQEAARGPEAVLAVSLSRYTKERPEWR